MEHQTFKDWVDAVSEGLHQHELSDDDVNIIIDTNEGKLRDHWSQRDAPSLVIGLIMRSVREMDG